MPIYAFFFLTAFCYSSKNFFFLMIYELGQIILFPGGCGVRMLNSNHLMLVLRTCPFGEGIRQRD